MRKINAIKIKYQNSNQAFTMVELLVVVAIIGLLTVLTLVSISHIRAKSRDAQRVADIKSIQESLAMYEYTYSQFPIYDGFITSNDVMSQALENTGIITQVPVDPVNKSSEGVNYRYYYKSDSGNDYLIQFYLETDSVHSKSQGLNSVKP